MAHEQPDGNENQCVVGHAGWIVPAVELGINDSSNQWCKGHILQGRIRTQTSDVRLHIVTLHAYGELGQS